MRILWYGNPPEAASGYGVQCELFVPRFAALGHDVAIAANTRVNLPVTTWQGHTVYSEGIMTHGVDTLRWHYQDFGADLLLMLTDAWQIAPETVAGCKVAAWLPVDGSRVGAGDRAFLEATGGKAIAMSRHGQRALEDMGRPAPLAYHGIDTSVFRPSADRQALRDKLDIGPDTFAVGINAQNTRRKAIAQSLAGFASFARHHPDSVVFLHSTVQRADPGSPYLPAVIDELGIKDKVRWGNHYAIVTCQQSASDMADLAGAMDVGLLASMGEGFGIPLVEFMACGTPVIGTRCSTMTELVPRDAGWLVSGIRDWNDGHQAWWLLPDPDDIARALTKADHSARTGDRRREAAAAWGATFSADLIMESQWKPILEAMEG